GDSSITAGGLLLIRQATERCVESGMMTLCPFLICCHALPVSWLKAIDTTVFLLHVKTCTWFITIKWS
ncbi:hypothetical protein ILYODFUR_021840, partial [Ilyodon furcidens]